jgi:hypothetical protein
MQTPSRHQNLYLKLYTTFPGAKGLKGCVPSIFLTIWEILQESAPAAGVHCAHCYKNSVYFNEKGTYKITLEQFTRTSPLPGISGVTLLLEDTGKKRQ